jgi:hypothetical protein
MSLEENTIRKYIETKDASDWEIMTDTGWEDLKSVSKTIKYEVWEIRTATKTLRCADNHILFYERFREVFCKDIRVGERVLTKDGLEEVVHVYNTYITDNMYDVDINNDNKRFFTNDILSHNSTVVGLYALWFAMFTTDPTNIFILSNKLKSAKSLLDDIKLTYEELVPYLKRGVEEYNKQSIKFDNRSVIQIGATTPDSIRGESVSLLILDEFAHIPIHIADDFYTSAQPTVASGGKMIIISTPKGNKGKFYELFQGAENNANGFARFNTNWRDVPRINDKGKKLTPDEFKEITIQAIGLQRWYQEHEVRFLGSARTLIDANTLEKIRNIVEEPNFTYNKWVAWEKPKKKHVYVMSVDVAMGVEKDYSVIQVFDVSEQHIKKQVARFRDNSTSPYDLADIIFNIANTYNKAYVIIENNTYGTETNRRLSQDLEYENVYRDLRARNYGITSSVNTKAIALRETKRYLENNKILIRDEVTYDELSGFIEVTPNVYKCERGINNFDDTVMALIWFVYFLETQFWKDLSSFLIQQVNGEEEEIEIDEKPQFVPFDFEKPRRSGGDFMFDDDFDSIF